jgi:hypothetical protein
MTTYDTVTGEWTDSASVSLPTGSDGDSMVFVAYTDGTNPGSFSGWSLNNTISVTGSMKFRIYSKTRAGGETTVTLPTVGGGSGGRSYSILNLPSTFAYNNSGADDLTDSSWSLTGSYNREAPRVAMGVLVCGDTGLSISGDFTQDSLSNNAGQDRDTITYVADIGSGTIDVSASGTWDAGGYAAWLVVFFTDEVVATSRKWWVGVVGWGATGGTG